MARRNRGVTISESGLERLQNQIDELVRAEKLESIKPAAIARHTERRGSKLSASTIGTILRQEDVDETSLKIMFEAFELTLTEDDITRNTALRSHNIPFTGTPNFVGRKQLLEDIHKLITDKHVSPIALSGMGGVGKTELSIQYARNYLQSFAGGVCWIFARKIDAPENASIPSQIISFAQAKLGIEIPDRLKQAHERVVYCWDHWPAGDVLLVFDDVDAYIDIYPTYIPNDPRFKVLLTTRLTIDEPVRSLPIDVLDRSDSLELLSRLVKDGRTKAETETNSLCDFLGDLPLGIELSGKYLAHDKFLSVAGFLAELSERAQQRRVTTYYPFDGDATQRPAWTLTARRGLDAAFDLTWERLSQSTQLVALLIGRLEPGPIGWAFVEEMRQVLAEEYPANGAYDSNDFTRSKHDLLLFNLLKPFNQESYRLHPLTREFFRSKIPDEEFE